MFLRGQGDSPVHICEPCEKLEEAARFERHGHKTRAGRGAILIPSKVVSSFVVVLNICRFCHQFCYLKLTSKPEDEVLNQILGNDRKESGQESNSNSGDGSASPEELRQQALGEKKYKILKGVGRSAEALRACKRGKELERLAV
ncbi:hypothetical protein GBA52_022139 [Prunus armeniaca]|nr:hypothetical protein GBA52_022139 [Prunus armeniaca]